MKNFKKIVGICVLLLFVTTAWQIVTCEMANYELRDEIKDVASMSGARIGLDIPKSDDDLRAEVIEKAAGHDIVLRADQIKVERDGPRDHPIIFIAARYQQRVWLPGLAVVFHFRATSR